MKKKVFFECGCCGCYHPDNFEGDCRDDSNRINAVSGLFANGRR